MKEQTEGIMIKVGIAGATGYVAIELIRILASHPQVELVYLATQSHTGRALKEVYPHLQSIIDIDCSPMDAEEMAKSCDCVFTALPHGVALDLADPILKAGKKLIDLGSDFRLKTPGVYEKWYGQAGAPTELLETATYGLPGIVSRQKIKGSQLIANPGCYPTCIAFGAFPAISSGIVKTEGMIFDAKSGVSGAGRGVSLNSHFCEVAENFKAYAIAGSHRHTPEIEQTLEGIAGQSVIVQFTPHLLPMVRGLLTTSYFHLKKEISPEAVWEIYSQAYKNEPFVRLYPLGELPQTANVRGSNYCDIGLRVDPRTKTLIIVSVIDNLIKGAAGQAVQNMNIMFELPETMGLNQLCPAYP
jgi:N-acetyl-gamma-glutamyl-phosphate reductase